MKSAVIRLYRPDGQIEDHRFSLPSFGEPDFYRATTSFNASADRWAAITCDRTWHKQGQLRVGGLSMKLVEDTRHWDPADLVVEHSNIWAAYAAVGYDYKRKRLT